MTSELHALLAKWGATIDAADHYPGYAECGEDIRMTVTVQAKHGPEFEVLQEWTEIDLGRNVSP